MKAVLRLLRRPWRALSAHVMWCVPGQALTRSVDEPPSQHRRQSTNHAIKQHHESKAAKALLRWHRAASRQLSAPHGSGKGGSAEGCGYCDSRPINTSGECFGGTMDGNNFQRGRPCTCKNLSFCHRHRCRVRSILTWGPDFVGTHWLGRFGRPEWNPRKLHTDSQLNDK